MQFLLLLVHVKIHGLSGDTVFTAGAIIRPLELTWYCTYTLEIDTKSM